MAKRWRRTAALRAVNAPTAPSAGVLVISVETAGNSVLWTFDTGILALSDSDGFTVDGFAPNSIGGITGAAVELIYDDNKVPGMPWDATTAVAGITFVDSRPLAPGQTGVTT